MDVPSGLSIGIFALEFSIFCPHVSMILSLMTSVSAFTLQLLFSGLGPGNSLVQATQTNHTIAN
jgi:hypothetical protein